MTPALRRSLAGLAMTVMAIVVAAFWLPRLKDRHLAESGADRNTDCNLNRGPCTVALDGGRSIEFAIEPRPVPVMKPLRLQLTTHGFVAPVTAQVDFSGVGMDMGFNRVELRRRDDGGLSGEGSLPVCVTGKMDWLAEVSIGAPEASRPTRISFRFRAPSDGN